MFLPSAGRGLLEVGSFSSPKGGWDIGTDLKDFKVVPPGRVTPPYLVPV